ncbi:MAG: hypothetical protein ACXQT4_05045 [Methanotrichaceae archaeon]
MMIGGCLFPCTRLQFNEIEILGRVRPELDLENIGFEEFKKQVLAAEAEKKSNCGGASRSRAAGYSIKIKTTWRNQ